MITIQCSAYNKDGVWVIVQERSIPEGEDSIDQILALFKEMNDSAVALGFILPRCNEVYGERKPDDNFYAAIEDCLLVVADSVRDGDVELGDDGKLSYHTNIQNKSGDLLVTIEAKELR